MASYDAANRLTQWGGTIYSYDDNGNFVSDGLTSYLWNSRDQLIGLSGGVSATFSYDGFGRRKSRTLQGTSTAYLYDGVSVVQEISGGTPIANLLAGPRIDEYFGRTGSQNSTMLADGLGSEIATTDVNGAVQTQYSYAPYGQVSTTGGVSQNDVTFTGRQVDVDGHLYSYRARYYDSQVGRFLSEDPIEFRGGLNLYQYVGDNPVNLTDPLGLVAWACRYITGTLNSPIGPGAGPFRVVCTSECVAGKRVEARLLGSMVGGSISGLPFGFATSTITLHDGFTEPDARNLEGRLLYSSVALVPGWGYSYTWLEMGGATGAIGTSSGETVGFDFGVDVYAGAVALTSSRTKKCCP